MKRLWLALALCGLFSCIDFDASRSQFCEKRPDVCFGDGGQVIGPVTDAGADAGDAGPAADAGSSDAGLDGGEDAGFDGGPATDAGADAGFDAGFDAGLDAGSRAITGWSLQLGGALCLNQMDLLGLGQSVSGDVAVLGIAQGTCDPGTGSAQLFSSATPFVTRFGPDGGAARLRLISGSFTPEGLAIDGREGVVVTGETSSSAQFDPGAAGTCAVEVSATGTAACVSRYFSDGGLAWVHAFASELDAGGAFASTPHLSAAGDSLAFAGRANGNVIPPAGCGAALPTASRDSWLVGKLDVDGGNCWYAQATCEGGVDDVAVDPSTGDVFVIGRNVNATAGSCAVLTSGGSTNVPLSGANYVAARFLAAGTAAWAREIPELPSDAGRAHLALSDGKLFVAAPFINAALASHFDAGVTSTSLDLVVFQLAPGDGRIFEDAGFRRFGSPGTDALTDFVVSPDGGLWLGGHGVAPGNIDFGGGPLALDGGADLFVARLDSNLGHRYSRILRGTGPSTLAALRASADAPAVMGVLKGTLDLGNGAMAEPATGKTSYVGKLSLP